MKQKRSIFILLLAISSLCIALIAVRYYKLANINIIPPNTPLFSLSTPDVTSMTISVNGESDITIKKDLGEWIMIAPYLNQNCDHNVIATLLNACEQATVIESLDEVQSNTTFLNALATTITLKTPDQTKSCQIGERLPLLQDEVYAKVSNTYLVTSAHLLDAIPTSPDAYRSTSLLPFSKPDIVAIKRRSPSKPFTQLTYSNEGVWQITQPVTFSVDRHRIHTLLETLVSTPISAYVLPSQDHPTGSLHAELLKYGLDDESSIRLQILLKEKTDPIELSLGKTVPNEPDAIYALLNRTQAIVKVDATIKALFDAPDSVFSLHDRQVFPLGDIQPQSLNVVFKGNTLQLINQPSGWHIKLPFNHPADNKVVDLLFSKLAALRVNILTQVQADLVQPQNRLADVSFSIENKDYTFTIYTIDKDKEHYLLSFPDENKVFSIPTDALPHALIKQEIDLDLLDKTILSIPPENIKRIAITQKDHPSTIALIKVKDDEWQTETPRGAFINEKILQPWLQTLATLKATRIIYHIQSPEDLATYGLDMPTYQITLDLLSGPALRHTLLFGKVSPVSGECTVMLRGQKIIYALDKSHAEQLKHSLISDTPLAQ